MSTRWKHNLLCLCPWGNKWVPLFVWCNPLSSTVPRPGWSENLWEFPSVLLCTECCINYLCVFLCGIQAGWCDCEAPYLLLMECICNNEKKWKIHVMKTRDFSQWYHLFRYTLGMEFCECYFVHSNPSSSSLDRYKECALVYLILWEFLWMGHVIWHGFE